MRSIVEYTSKIKLRCLVFKRKAFVIYVDKNVVTKNFNPKKFIKFNTKVLNIYKNVWLDGFDIFPDFYAISYI